MLCRHAWFVACLSAFFAAGVSLAGTGSSGYDPRAIQQALDRPPRLFEKPFAPADGSVSTINPPAFVWLPLPGKLARSISGESVPRDSAAKGSGKQPESPTTYVLAVSRSAEFAEGASTELFTAPISVHIPTHPLAAGQYYWRVGVAGRDGAMIWSQKRTFTLASQAAAWPFPKIDRLVARVPRQHPRLFFPGDALAKARAEWPKAAPREYRSLLRMAEAALGKPLYPEPEYIRGQGPERGRQYVQVIRSSRPPMDAMETCALAYLLSGDRRFGEEAKRLLLHFFAWDPEGSTSLFHNDEPAMWVMQRGSRAYDWTYDLFTVGERATIEPAMKARALQFVRRLKSMPFESNPYSSHPARDVGFLGEAALCFVHEWPEARDWLEYVLKLYWSVYPAWAGDDGGWQEGPGYWNAYQSFALHFATALRQATGEEITRKPFFHNTPYYKLYTNPPYARMSPFGDGQDSPPGAGAGHLLYAFSTLVRDPYLRWYPDMQATGPGASPMGVALTDPTLRSRPPLELPQARVFPGAGLVAMHDDLCDPERSAYLVFRSSPLGSISHGHADQNAFVIEAFGQALAIASGYYPWYGSPHHEHWTRQTKAVNSITFDGGQGQVGRSAEARGQIRSFLCGKFYDYAWGDAAAAYGGKLIRFFRHVIHVRPATFVIVDELESPQPVRFEWNLHALEKMEIRAAGREVLIRRGGARLLASFATPQELTFAQTDQFTPPPENNAANQWHLVAATKEKVTKTQFVVVLRAFREAENLKPPRFSPIASQHAQGSWSWNADGLESQLTVTPGENSAAIELTSTWKRTGQSARLVAGAQPAEHANAAHPAASLLTINTNGALRELRGRASARDETVWEDSFDAADARYRIRLPAGLKLLVGVHPVHDGDAVALRRGDRLWWYGTPSDKPAVLERTVEKR